MTPLELALTERLKNAETDIEKLRKELARHYEPDITSEPMWLPEQASEREWQRISNHSVETTDPYLVDRDDDEHRHMEEKRHWDAAYLSTSDMFMFLQDLSDEQLSRFFAVNRQMIKKARNLHAEAIANAHAYAEQYGFTPEHGWSTKQEEMAV